MNLRQEIKEIVSELAIDYDRTSVDPDDVTTKIIQLFEKRIDLIKQNEINYVTCNENGSEEVADIINDMSVASYWDGVKSTINQFKEMLK